jgi:hypothetical protein
MSGFGARLGLAPSVDGEDEKRTYGAKSAENETLLGSRPSVPASTND